MRNSSRNNSPSREQGSNRSFASLKLARPQFRPPDEPLEAPLLFDSRIKSSSQSTEATEPYVPSVVVTSRKYLKSVLYLHTGVDGVSQLDFFRAIDERGWLWKRLPNASSFEEIELSYTGRYFQVIKNSSVVFGLDGSTINDAAERAILSALLQNAAADSPPKFGRAKIEQIRHALLVPKAGTLQLEFGGNPPTDSNSPEEWNCSAMMNQSSS